MQRRTTATRPGKLLLLLTSLCLAQPIAATGATLHLAELGADEVRGLRESREIMSLESLLQQIRRDHPGRVIEIELEADDNRYVYELEIVDDNGKVWEIEVDARTGELLERELED